MIFSSPAGIRISVSRLRGLTDVAAALEQLDHELPGSPVSAIRYFNHAYLIITHAVLEAYNRDTFDHPDFLNRFDARFASYYLTPLMDYLAGRTVPPAWADAFTDHNISAAAQMALGINAHINNDIPQVLRDCDAQAQHFRDYCRINYVIASSISEVLSGIEHNGPLGIAKYVGGRPVYHLGMELLARRWRARAWQAFRRLEAGDTSLAEIEADAERTARSLHLLPI